MSKFYSLKSLCVSCWTAYILQDDTRSIRYQITRLSWNTTVDNRHTRTWNRPQPYLSNPHSHPAIHGQDFISISNHDFLCISNTSEEGVLQVPPIPPLIRSPSDIWLRIQIMKPLAIQSPPVSRVTFSGLGVQVTAYPALTVRFNTAFMQPAAYMYKINCKRLTIYCAVSLVIKPLLPRKNNGKP